MRFSSSQVEWSIMMGYEKLSLIPNDDVSGTLIGLLMARKRSAITSEIGPHIRGERTYGGHWRKGADDPVCENLDNSFARRRTCLIRASPQ